MSHKKILFIVTEDWYFISHRLNLAKFMISKGFEVGVICNASEHQKKIENENIKFYDWKIVRGKFNPFLNIIYLIRLKNYIRSFQPDLIHVISLQSIIYIGLLSFFFTIKNKFYVVSGFGSVFSSTKAILSKAIKPIIKILLTRIFVDKNMKIITQNIDDKKKLIDLKMAKDEQVSVILDSGVDTDLFVPNKKNNKDLIVLLPARMLWSKGIETFVKCAKKTRNSNKMIKFVLAGRLDPLNPESIEEYIIKRWEDDRLIEWWGECDNMHEVYQKSSIVCLPSVAEGFPKCLIEAASCGKPIVTYDIPGCREIVINDYNGFLVKKDENSLCKAINKLINDETLRDNFGKNGRNFAINNFSEELIFSKIYKFWLNTI